MKYNYVFFDAGAVKNNQNDRDNYYYICTEDLRKCDEVIVVSYPMDWMEGGFHRVFHAFWVLLNKMDPSLCRCLYPFYFKNTFDINKPICFVIYGYYVRPSYLRYLKKKYPDCKIVKIHRDLINIWKKRNSDYSDEKINELFDLSMTYDQNEANLYNIPYFQEIESKTYVELFNTTKKSDLFFAGYAKDRFPMLKDIYVNATQRGLKCDFYLVGVDECDRVQLDGIIYAEKGLSYREMLNRTVTSKCILEINQGGAVGYTSRFLEAVIYNVKLLTNNYTIKNNKYYKEEYIQCFDSIDNIDYGFITKDVGIIDFNYQDDFSPIHLINQIEGIISNGK